MNLFKQTQNQYKKSPWRYKRTQYSNSSGCNRELHRIQLSTKSCGGSGEHGLVGSILHGRPPNPASKIKILWIFWAQAEAYDLILEKQTAVHGHQLQKNLKRSVAFPVV